MSNYLAYRASLMEGRSRVRVISGGKPTILFILLPDERIDWRHWLNQAVAREQHPLCYKLLMKR